MRGSRLHERDFYAWANEQAELLRAGRLAEADIGHIAEEIESMGKAEKRELVLDDNPSLRPLLDAAIAAAYRRARRDAAAETGLEERAFPVACPWSFAEIAAEDCWPGGGEP